MKAYGNQIKKRGDVVVVFTDERPPIETQFEIRDTREQVLNVAIVREIEPTKKQIFKPTKRYRVSAVILA